MGELGDLLGAAKSFQIAGKNCTIVPFTLKDMVDYENFQRDRKIRRLKELHQQGLIEAADLKDRLKVLLDGEPRPESEEEAKAQASRTDLEEILFLACKSIRIDGKTVAQEEIEQLITTENLVEVTEALFKMLAGSSDDGKKVEAVK